MSLALVGLAAGVGAYVWSMLPRPVSPPPATSRPVPASMDWRSASAGSLVVLDSGSPASYLFHTADGGVHWRRQLAIDGPGLVSFADARHGTVEVARFRGQTAQVQGTDDGGAHWRPIGLPEIDPASVTASYFADGETGWILAGGALYRTADGGRHWERLPGSGLPANVGTPELLFSGRTGWLAGDRAVLARTLDGGRTWAPQPLATVAGMNPDDQLQVLAPAAGGRVLPVYDAGGDQVWLLASDDGGATWRDPRPLPGGPGARRPSFTAAGAGWTIAASGAWSTVDAGRTWRLAAGLGPGWEFGSVVDAVSASVAWVDAVQVSGAGAPAPWGLFRTTDGGRHWSHVSLPTLG